MKNWKCVLRIALAAGMLSASGWAAEPAPSPITPGTYRVSVMPDFNHAVAEKIQARLGKITGLDGVSTRSEDSTIHFTVKDHSTVDLSQLQKGLTEADSGAVMSSPVLEHTLTPNPGL